MSVVSGTPVRELRVSVIISTRAQVPTGSGRRGRTVTKEGGIDTLA